MIEKQHLDDDDELEFYFTGDIDEDDDENDDYGWDDNWFEDTDMESR